MASEDTPTSTDASETRADVSETGADITAPPTAKKAARKRAPRKATAAVAAPEASPASEPSPGAGDAEPASSPVADAGMPQPATEATEATAPAPRKRASRARKSTAAVTAPAESTTPPATQEILPSVPSEEAVRAVEAVEAEDAQDAERGGAGAKKAAARPSKRAAKTGTRSRRATSTVETPAPSEPAEDAAPASLVDEDALRFDALELPTAQAAAPVEAPVRDLESDDESDEDTDEGDEAESVASAVVPVFRAPVTRRRRASSPTSAPAPAAPPTDDAPADGGAPAQPDRGPDAPLEAAPASDQGTDDGDAEEGDANESSGSPRRRRRRGGKGRRGRSGDTETGSASSGAESTPSGDAGETEDHDEPRSDDESDRDAEPSSSSRRRTRRRRRSGGGDGDADEAPGVTTKVRESRRDEVTALRGSTRLEAKKQRRREGREAGRRRTVITEAEFLARRESVERVMVVRHLGDRTQIGVLEDDVLVEHYISKETEVSMAGNIYLGRVQNVLPSMEAAFVDIGKGRNAVLYAGEVNWDAAGLEQHQAKRIENALSSGESVLVQVTKDPIGHKGARLTSQISLPGRYLVYVPNSSMTGISRKLPDTERARLKRILKDVLPETAGVIVRTAAEGASEEELRADVERLTATWEDIQAKAEAATGGGGKKKNKSGGAPLLLHGEPDLTVRVIRDIFNEDFAQLVVAGEDAWSEVSTYVNSVAPDLAERVTRWTREDDLFTHYRVDEQIAKAMDRKVWLPSGGSLVIDRTEAMTVVDVNTGKFIGSGGNLEETVTKNNIEAAEEIVRQLRLRDVGGIIVIDFIDMVLESNRDLVVRRLLECLGRDRTKHQVAEVTSLGLVQMTRKRVGSGLIEVFSETCAGCGGRGFIIHSEPVDKSSGAHQHDHDASGSAGSGHGRDQQSSGRSRSRGGSGSSSSGSGSSSGSAGGQQVQGHGPAAAPVRPGGPTPAQIAAAAHAAALKTAASAVEAGADPVAAIQDAPLDVVVELDTTSTPESTPESMTGATPEPETTASTLAPEADPAASEPTADTAYPVSVSEPVSAPVSEAIPEPTPEPAPATAPTGRTRRHRGRVVAPAGPPRAASDEGRESAPVG